MTTDTNSYKFAIVGFVKTDCSPSLPIGSRLNYKNLTQISPISTNLQLLGL